MNVNRSVQQVSSPKDRKSQTCLFYQKAPHTDFSSLLSCCSTVSQWQHCWVLNITGDKLSWHIFLRLLSDISVCSVKCWKMFKKQLHIGSVAIPRIIQSHLSLHSCSSHTWQCGRADMLTEMMCIERIFEELSWFFKFIGLCTLMNSCTTNKMQSYTMVFITLNVQHISGGSSAHHQELKTLYTASGICRAFSASYR